MKTCFITTHSGVAFDLLNPRPEDVRLEDIAWALAHINRFTGHASVPYSVLEHSIRVHDVVVQTNPELGAVALLHDAAEAYVGDVASPIKAAMRVIDQQQAEELCSVPPMWSAYDALEYKAAEAIGKRFGLTLHPTHPIVKAADRVLYVTEKRDLMPEDARTDEVFGERPTPLKDRIWPSATLHCLAIQRHFLALCEKYALK